eukprot:CAMPEP_0183482968 /NCGR_PEP_ID=MMETSP0370-20130417/177559_1 /TAXON_ID=268820 /ORGANISM="Peridinium aciculiferum, Strain PAER-2" /LENGTH=30 /DNA_ID= /DNA_START= /DNA_END= /DNA_ORIENTATION=
MHQVDDQLGASGHTLSLIGRSEAQWVRGSG